MFLRIIPVGDLRENCYIVADDVSKQALIIDPGAQPERILPIITKNNLIVTMILLTHGHYDHVGAVAPTKELTGAPVGMHPLDVPIMRLMDDLAEVLPPAPDFELSDGQQIVIGDLNFQVMHTPGHSPGGICLAGEGVVFSGDTLFAGDIGRYDLPGSSKEALKASLLRLMELPGEIIVYPGHGVSTTIEAERRLY